MPLGEHVYCVAVAFKMTEQVEQWICIKFCVNFEYSSMENIRMIQKDFRDNTMSIAPMKVWHKCFKDGWKSFESSHSRRPVISRTPENVERVQSAISKDPWLTVWELEADLGPPETTMADILMQDPGMKCVMAKFLLWLLLPEQKEHRVAVVNGLIQMASNEPDFL